MCTRFGTMSSLYLPATLRRRAVLRSFATIAFVCACAAMSHAQLNLNACDAAGAPTGTPTPSGTLVASQDVEIFIANPSNPTTSHVIVNAYRGSDNTITFTYSITGITRPAWSNGALRYLYVADYASATSLVDFDPAIPGLPNTWEPASVRRLCFPSGTHQLEFDFPFWLYPGEHSYQLWVKTNANAAAHTGSVALFDTDNFAGNANGVLGPANDTTPPVAILDAPTALACNCNNLLFQGTANDPDGTFRRYITEYARASGGPWITAITGSFPADSAFLGSIDLSTEPEGLYLVRLRVQNTAGLESQDTRVVYFDRQLDTFSWSGPREGDHIRNLACFGGFIEDNGDTCPVVISSEYRDNAGVFQPVDPANPVWFGRAANQSFAGWQTASGPTSVPDGPRQIRVRASNGCNTREEIRNVVIDNTPPVADISAPLACSYVDGVVQIRGTASDANLWFWELHYTTGEATDWTEIAHGTTSIANGLLANWNTVAIPDCAYTLRLRAWDRAASCTGAPPAWVEQYVSLNVGPPPSGGCLGDLNGDHVVDISDLAIFLSRFAVPCP